MHWTLVCLWNCTMLVYERWQELFGYPQNVYHLSECIQFLFWGGRRELLRLPEEPKPKQAAQHQDEQQPRERRQKGRAHTATPAPEAGARQAQAHIVVVFE